MTDAHGAEAAPAATTGPAPRDPSTRTPEELRRDLGELRADLGDTVEELAHRVDVPARMRAKKQETAERVQVQLAQAREVIAEKAPEVQQALRERPAVVGGLALLLSYLLVGRLRRRRRARAERKDRNGTR